jgi:SNF family Na+-dependent transporter
MSTGCSVLVFFGSYRPYKQEIFKSSILIPILTSLCGFLAALVVFSFMGYLSKLSNIAIQNLPLKGPELTFIVFPAALTLMPGSNFWAVIFYAIMLFLGIDT